MEKQLLFRTSLLVFLLTTTGQAQDASYGGEAPPATVSRPAPPPLPPPGPAPAYGGPAAPAAAPVLSSYVPAPPAPPPGNEAGYEGGEGPLLNSEKALGEKNLGFPLPSCYFDKDGFMCCNKELENLMANTYRNLSQTRGGKWKKCNIHQVAIATQRNAEKHFDVDFEVVVGAGDFASKNYFNQDLICKIKRDNS